MTIAGCWFGGVWSEGEGADSPETRAATSEARCHEATRLLFGSDDKDKYEQLRAYEANSVDDAAKKVSQVASGDAVDGLRKDALGKLVMAIAAAKKEEMLARRAGDRVRRDLAREPEKLSADEAAATGPLLQISSLEQLLKLDAGDLSAEAHAFGVLSAMERLAVSRGLPKHLKVYAVSGPLKLLFGVEPPAVPTDATKPLKGGTWLAYLVTAAKGAGHPVPDAAKTPAEKEPAAWAGVLEGLRDKLAPDQERISGDTPLKGVVERVVRRLEREVNEERNSLRKAPAPATSAAPAVPPRAPKK